MPYIQDWRGDKIEVAQSAGGVLAVADPWHNVVRAGVSPWPPPELIQKLYQSRQVRAFHDANEAAAIRALGYYSDLQSIHSEDAITWSVFGPLVYATPEVRERFVRALLGLIDIPHESTGNAHVWLWRRVPHPDTLVLGGPEVDFGIQTDALFLLGEAKWRSQVSATQGVARNKDQITLRREFCEKYGRRLLPNCLRFVVLGISPAGGIVPILNTEAESVSINARDTTWQKIAGLDSHPAADELRAYIEWKARNSHAT